MENNKFFSSEDFQIENILKNGEEILRTFICNCYEIENNFLKTIDIAMNYGVLETFLEENGIEKTDKLFIYKNKDNSLFKAIIIEKQEGIDYSDLNFYKNLIEKNKKEVSSIMIFFKTVENGKKIFEKGFQIKIEKKEKEKEYKSISYKTINQKKKDRIRTTVLRTFNFLRKKIGLENAIIQMKKTYGVLIFVKY